MMRILCLPVYVLHLQEFKLNLVCKSILSFANQNIFYLHHMHQIVDCEFHIIKKKL